jgi:hypothetical protein
MSSYELVSTCVHFTAPGDTGAANLNRDCGYT